MKNVLDPLLPPKSNESSDRGSSDSPEPLGPRRLHPWTRLHSHYALMGGFAFDTSKVATQFLPEGRTRLTLTSTALRRLALYEPDLIPDISAEHIREKGKADGFAKAIVCLQALWFIAQVIGRLAAKLPISLLEMNTFLHALCCLAIYCAWWNKPLDIEQPSLIDASKDPARKICAWMVMQSAIGNRPTLYNRPWWIHFDEDGFCHLVYEEDVLQDSREHESLSEAKAVLDKLAHHNRRQHRADSVVHDEDIPPLVVTNMINEGGLKLYAGQEFLGFRLIASLPSLRPINDAYAHLSPANVECLRLARAFREEHHLTPGWHFGPLTDYSDPSANMVVPAASARSQSSKRRTTDDSLKKWTFAGQKRPKWALKWPFSDSDDSTWSFYMGLIIAGGLYGGGHLLAWNGPFSSAGEKTFWRICALFLAGTFPVVIVAYLLFTLVSSLLTILWAMCRKSKRVRTWQERWSAQSWFQELQLEAEAEETIREGEPFRSLVELIAILVSELPRFIPQIVFIYWFVCYWVARVYLVMESFKGLAYLPDKVYQEPDWSQFIAHVGAG